MSETHHVFLSYARKDNAAGRITAFRERMKRDYLAATGRELTVYFDKEDIHGMDHWEHNILQHLQGAHVLLACISPAYLTSDYCRWEFEEYVKREINQGLSEAGVAAVYAFEVPDWKTRDYETRAPDWVRRLRKRQTFDLLSAFQPPAEPAPGEALIATLADRIRRASGSAQSPGWLDPHNPFFTGREEEMLQLHKRLVKPESVAGFTILHGLGGMGKTSLAMEYAHNFAHEYPAGRWQVKCRDAQDLTTALATLEGPLGLHLSNDQPPLYRAQRVLAELQKRALENLPEGAKPRCCLLILDNADNPALLALDQTRILPRAEWLHVVITSQLGPADLPDLYDERVWLEVEKLSEEASLRLLERQQRPNQRFRDAEEKDRAREVAAALDGFTLGVEMAAVFLAQFPGEGCTALLREMSFAGLEGFERATAKTTQNILHEEKRLTITLGPILDRLQPDEWLTVEYASLMPPDAVAWEWIESLVGDKFPDVEKAETTGEIGRWTAIREHLQGLRLVTGSAEVWAGRMHALVQEVVWLRDGFGRKKLRKQLIEFAFRRCASLERDWEDRAGDWEVEALRRWAVHLMDEDELGGGALEERVAGLLRKLGRYRDEEPLRRHVLKVRERVLGHEAPKTAFAVHNLGVNLFDLGQFHESADLMVRALALCERSDGEMDPKTLACVSGLGSALSALGDLAGAEPLYRRALEASERVLGTEHPNTLTSVNNLAALLDSQGKYDEAEPLYRRALEACERVLGSEHPDTLGSVNNLAYLLQSQGKYDEAEPLFRRALEARDRVLGAEHPDTLTSVNNLAYLLDSQGKYDEAKPLHRRALEACERVLGPEHPYTLISLNNLAGLLESQGKYDEAEPLYRRALEAGERVLGAEHPDTLVWVNNLAGLLESQGKYDEAEPLYRRAVEGARKVLGPEHPQTKLRAANYETLLAKMTTVAPPDSNLPRPSPC
jgi:tetratricopeptide (TPR) repeat protein